MFPRQILIPLLCAAWIHGPAGAAASGNAVSTSHYERGPAKDAVIVFVHGFLGDATGTWTSPNGSYWPRLLLQDSAFDGFDVYVLSYPTYLGGNATIEDIVSRIHADMQRDGIFTRHREAVFVCHSLGGIVIERLLLDHPEVATHVPFIYFLGTPFTGSAIASYVSFFGSNPVTHALNDGQDNDSLQFLENSWKANASKIVRYCGAES
jgi:pimeloyl-ACP methyl ester carboxylesterase